MGGGSPATVGVECRRDVPTLAAGPDASIVIPVNAQGDLENVLKILADLSRYSGDYFFEIVLVVNNYPPGEPPTELDDLRARGLRVVSTPDVRRPGEAVGLTARVLGVEAATSEFVILFDADCRVVNPTALLNWSVRALRSGAHACYPHVGFYDLADTWPNRARLVIHHGARWVKRVILRIPTTRGGGYAVRRSVMVQLYRRGMLADDMNVGPTVKATRGQVVYSGARDLMVLTSGRMCTGRSWRSLIRHYAYRLRYNLRVLPVRTDVARQTGREKDPVRRYVDNRPVT